MFGDWSFPEKCVKDDLNWTTAIFSSDFRYRNNWFIFDEFIPLVLIFVCWSIVESSIVFGLVLNLTMCVCCERLFLFCYAIRKTNPNSIQSIAKPSMCVRACVSGQMIWFGGDYSCWLMFFFQLYCHVVCTAPKMMISYIRFMISMYLTTTTTTNSKKERKKTNNHKSRGAIQRYVVAMSQTTWTCT